MKMEHGTDGVANFDGSSVNFANIFATFVATTDSTESYSK